MTRIRLDPQLRMDFSWVLSGNIVYSACQFGIVVLLAKLGSLEQVGQYALGMAVAAPILVFANLQLRTLLASDVKDQFRFGQYLAFCLASMGIAILAIVAVSMWSAPDWRHRDVIILVGLAQGLEYVSDIFYGLMQKCGRMDRLSRSLLFKGPLSLAALGVAMYVTGNVVWGVIALALGRLFILLVWDSRLRYVRNVDAAITARLEWKLVDMGQLLRIAFPLGLISMLAALNGNIPRYFIEAHLGTANLGIYAAIASLLTAGTMVVSAFGQAIMVPAARACAEGDQVKYRSFLIYAVVLGIVLGGSAALCAWTFGHYLLAHLFRREYAEHTDLLTLLMSVTVFLFISDSVGYLMTAARALKSQVPLLAAKCIAAAAASAWLIPKHGLRGAVEAILMAALVHLVGAAMILWRIDRRLAGYPCLEEATEPTGLARRSMSI